MATTTANAGLERARLALYRGVLDDPDDDGPRMVYADWLEEHADAYEPWAGWERAEFIRIQIEKAAMVEDAPAKATMPSTPTPRWQLLSSRETELLAANTLRWLGAPPFVRSQRPDWRPVSGVRMQTVEFTGSPPGRRRETRYDGGWYDPKGRHYICVDFDRGFVGRVVYHDVPLFNETCQQLFARHPVTHVKLADRVPLVVEPGVVCWLGPKSPVAGVPVPLGNMFTFNDARKAFLARGLFRALTPCPSRPTEYKADTANFYTTAGMDAPPRSTKAASAAATDDLARACLVVGRGRAKTAKGA
jgi:uncharacterized protein (TIGR02996 family)